MKAQLDADLKQGVDCELCFSDGQIKKLKLTSIAGAVSSRMLFFEGVNDPEQAKDLWGAEIRVRREDLPELPKDQFYADDLSGMTAHDAGRGMLGKVVSVWRTGSNDCMEIQPEHGESFLLPMTDEVIESIDTDLKVVKVRLLQGLHPDDEA